MMWLRPVGAMCLAAGISVLAVGVMGAAGQRWSTTGVGLPADCQESTPVQLIRAPDPRTGVEVRCGGLSPDQGAVTLRILTSAGGQFEHRIEVGSWRPQEIVWAPDSSAFIVNGSESAYAGNDFILYRLLSGRAVETKLTAAAQRDMALTFPPCRASGLREPDCQAIARNPQFNMSVIAWAADANAVVVFAEVPCSSTYGGIMCQVRGYQLEVPTGRILERMDASELKSRYQAQMAWPMTVPDRPSYKR
jgi:hypothetical protein